MIQEIIVGIIGVVVFFIVLVKLYRFFFVTNEQKASSSCSNCAWGNASREK